MICFYLRDSGSMHGSLIVGMELRISQLEDKMSDVDARASEEADCNANDRDLDRFIYSGTGQFKSLFKNYDFRRFDWLFPLARILARCLFILIRCLMSYEQFLLVSVD